MIEEIYSCRSKCDCLKEYVDCQVPEPFIGNLHAKFAFIGTNPGPYCESQRSFGDVTEYIYYHEEEFFKEAPEELWIKGWVKGYLEAYRIFLNQPNANLDEFYENTIILNVVKCSTSKNFGEIPKCHREKAKENCVRYLIRQLALTKPLVILSHGRFACDTIIELLVSGTHYQINAALSSCNVESIAGVKMNAISNHYLVCRNKEGHEILFFFNKHLSYFGSAKHSLMQNLDEKKAMVSKVLGQE